MEKKNSQEILNLDGVIYQELKSLVIQDGPDAGKEEQVLVHTRSIGDKNYTVRKEGFGSDQEKILEVLEHNKLNSIELATFQEVWSKKPNLRIPQQQSGGFIRFFKKLFKYE